MNALIQILAKSGLLTKDLDYHLIRASMVLIFLAFGYQKWFAYEAQVLIPYISNGPPCEHWDLISPSVVRLRKAVQQHDRRATARFQVILPDPVGADSQATDFGAGLSRRSDGAVRRSCDSSYRLGRRGHCSGARSRNRQAAICHKQISAARRGCACLIWKAHLLTLLVSAYFRTTASPNPIAAGAQK
jgi:Protein of unknown function, DUF417